MSLFQPFELDLDPGETDHIEATSQPGYWHVYPRASIGAGGVRLCNGPSIKAEGSHEIVGLMSIELPARDTKITLENRSSAAVHLFVTAVRGTRIHVRPGLDALPLGSSHIGAVGCEGWIDGAWHKAPIPFGVSEIYAKFKSTFALPSGAGSVDVDPVEIGNIAVVTNVVFRYDGATATLALIQAVHDGSAFTLLRQSNPVSGEEYPVQGWWPLDAGDTIRCVIYDSTYGDDLRLWAYGFEYQINA